jgi:ubiquinone/menaquinone biosynthesis C-methylase UbiE
MSNCNEDFRLDQFAKSFFVHNLKVNGFRALIYCFGLSASRYVEYSAALTFLLNGAKRISVLEVGCGHSILPTYLKLRGTETIVVDINREALKWQIQKGKRCSTSGVAAVLADARFLPFANGSFDSTSGISSIEHIPYDGDARAVSEMARILSYGGTFVISLSTQEVPKVATTEDWGTNIPAPLRKVFGSSLPIIMNKVGVDRKHEYFERFYSKRDITERIVRPSKCKEKDSLSLKSRFLMRFLHRKIIPTGALTLLEYALVRFFDVGRRLNQPDAVILKLTKAE